jgi:hypothetical protein
LAEVFLGSILAGV